MAGVAIARLHLRGPPALASSAAFRIEDALRTEIPDGERLVLVRRLALDRRASGRERAIRSAAVRAAYHNAVAAAPHGGADSGAEANCVWFASRGEARRLLLASLLAGRRPTGWYWPLAVPEWRGRSLREWLPALVEAALDGDDGTDLLVLAAQIVEGGEADALLETLAGPAGARLAARFAPPPARWADVETTAEPESVAGAAPAPEAALPARLARLRRAIPAHLRQPVEALAMRFGPQDRIAALLIERMLLVASPAIALAPALLAALRGAYAEMLSGAPATIVPAAATPASPPRLEDDALESPREARTPAPDPAVAKPPQAPSDARPRPTGVAPLLLQPVAGAPAPPLAAAFEEIASPAAGLWLVIPSLIRMGFRDWLAERPDLLCDSPGRVLLRTIAAHHRVPLDDPALAPLDLEFRDPPGWALLWRVGLDRWLRRRARIGLARLVWRSGRIACGDGRILIRFPLAAADLRLRRRALDVDPGWTDWLGLSVRYSYSDRPQ